MALACPITQPASLLWERVRGEFAAEAATGMFVPGRIEVLGKHTDYCGGRSLICAVERGICIAGRPRQDSLVRIRDLASGEQLELPFDAELQPRQGHWSNYPATVLRRLARNFPDGRSGAEIVLLSNLPQASGLSSSSALITAFALLLARLSGLDESTAWKERLGTPELLASYLGFIENGQSFGSLAGDRGVGTFGGSQDHVAILCSKAGQLSQYSFTPVRFERDVAMPDDCTFLIGSSGVVAEKTGDAMAKFNDVSLRVRAIVEEWNRHSGRHDACLAQALDSSADAPAMMERMLAALPPSCRDLPGRLRQHVEESRQIIPQAGDALAAGDLETFGRLAARSHKLADELLRNQVPQTNFLVASARESGAVAASAFGAGFGGSVWALVRRAEAENVLSRWHHRYAAEYPAQTEKACFFQTQPSQGLQWLE